MAKYKRHSQGGRFRTANFGDLGLRAYKDQQNQQIQSLKDQSRQEQQISESHLREMRGSASREIEHNRQLQNFYNKRDNLTIENTEFRGKTEYDRLMGEAKEYEKKAAFWKDFSQTYAGQYVKAAGGIYDIAATHQSNNQLDIIYNDPKFKKFEASKSKLNNISSKAQLDEAVSILRDKKASPDQKNDYLGHIVDLGFRMNHKTKLALIQRELNHWDQEHLNLRSLAAERNLQWSADTVGQFYYIRARELLRAYDIDPSSKAGRALLKGVDDEATKQRNVLSGVAKANADGLRREELSEQTRDLVGKVNYAVHNGEVVSSGQSAIEYNNDFNTRIIFEGNSYRLTEQGQVVKPVGGNIHNDMVSIMKSDIEAGRFKTKEQAKRHTILQLIPGAKVKYEDDGQTMVFSEKDTWLGKHPSVLEEFEEAWNTYEKKQYNEFKEKELIRDYNATQSIKERALNGDIDLSDKKVITELIKTNSNNPETVKFLGNFQVYNAYDLNGDIITADLTQKFKDGKLKQLEEHLTFLPPDVQDEWRGKLEQLKILERNGYIGAGLTQKAKGILVKILGDEATKPGKLTGDHFQEVTSYIKQDILATFNEVSERMPNASEADKIDAMRVEIQRKIDANEGVYRRGNSGLSTIFFIDPAVPELGQETVISQQQLDNELKGGVKSYDNVMNGVFEDGSVELSDGTRVRLVSINDADTAVRNINLGIDPPFNKTIDHIVKNQPIDPVTGTKKYTERDIWNEYFKGVGIDTQIPPNAVDFSTYNIAQSQTKANTANLNTRNKIIVGAYCTMADEGLYVQGEPTEEQKKVEKKRGLFSHPFWTMPNPLAN